MPLPLLVVAALLLQESPPEPARRRPPTAAELATAFATPETRAFVERALERVAIAEGFALDATAAHSRPQGTSA